MGGLTFDTGALVALERRKARIGHVWTAARARGALITVPSVVVVEWWKHGARKAAAEAILAAVTVEWLDTDLAKIAAEAHAATGSGAVDAVVMASAAQRGDVAYTQDVADLEALRAHFPAVRVLRA